MRIGISDKFIVFEIDNVFWGRKLTITESRSNIVKVLSFNKRESILDEKGSALFFKAA
jgi:hypothetical protein